MRIILVLAFVALLLSCNSNHPKKVQSLQTLEDSISVIEQPVKFDTIKVSEKTFIVYADSAEKFLENKVSEDEVETEENLEIKDLYKKLAKAPEVFNLDVKTDTILVCKEGTRITIKANSFVKENGDEVNGKVHFKVKEYYALSDILLADLTTTSNGKMLETGGMVHLEALSDGVKCKLKEGKPIKIEFPYEEEKEDMQLFSGNWNDEQINWNLITMNTAIESEIYMVVEQMPDFPGGTPKLFEYFSQNITYPEVAKENRIEGTVYVQFVIDENGKVTKPQILRGVHPSLDQEALSVLRKMPNWLPGSNGGKNAPVRMQVPIKFDLGLGGASKNTLNDYIRSEVEDNTLSPQKVDVVSRYAFMDLGLGWINCDRFINSNKKRIDYLVNTNTYKKTDVKIIFHKYKSIQRGIERGNRYSFRNIPENEKITILAFKYLNQHKIGLAIRHTNSKTKTTQKLEFKPVTIAMLKEEMERLNETVWN